MCEIMSEESEKFDFTHHSVERMEQRRFTEAQVRAIIIHGDHQEKPGGASAYIITRKVLEQTKNSDVKFRKRDIGATIVISDRTGAIITTMRGNPKPGRTPTSARRAVHRNKKPSRRGKGNNRRTLH
jgi:hypothetical protein